MQQIDDVAVVNANDNLRDVVIAMTDKPQGAAIVICKDNEFGIITDGDLRRLLVEGNNIDSLVAEKAMTSDPISVSIEMPLDNALKLMEDRKSQISILPVIDSNNRCVGLIRLHDIYQTHLF